MDTGKLPDALDGVSTGCELNLDPRLPHIGDLHSARACRLHCCAESHSKLANRRLKSVAYHVISTVCPKGSRPAPHNAFGEFDRLESIRTPRSRVLLAAARPYASARSMSARSMPIISRAAATARALTAAVGRQVPGDGHRGFVGLERRTAMIDASDPATIEVT